MKSVLRSALFLISLSLCMAAGNAHADDWQHITHGGLSFAIPGGWQNFKQRDDEGQWGIRDEARREGIMFGIDRTRRPERQLDAARKEGLQVERLAPVEFTGLAGERYRIRGNDDELGRVESQLVVLDGLLSNGAKVTYQVSAVRQVDPVVLDTMERVITGVAPTDELIALLTGSSRQSFFDDAISVEVRNNWKRRDHYSDAMAWSPPGVTLWGGDLIEFVKGWGLGGRNGLLSELADASLEEIELFGGNGWKIRGTGAAFVYADAARSKQVPATTTVFVSDTCLGPGEPFGYAISGTDAQLAEYEEAVRAVIASIELHLPDTAGPCDGRLPYQWKRGLTIEVPRSWRRDMNQNLQFSFFGRDIAAAAYTQLHVYHGIAEEHPVAVQGEGDDAATRLAALTVDGYPATHYRRVQVASNGEQSQYDTYVLDTRMRYRQQQPTFLSFRFTTSPPVADALSGLQRGILSSVRLDADWMSETPVQRGPPAADPQQTVAAEQVQEADGVQGQARPANDEGETAESVPVPAPVAQDQALEQTPAAGERPRDDRSAPAGAAGAAQQAAADAATDGVATADAATSGAAAAATPPTAAPRDETGDGSRPDGADAAAARRLDYEAAKALRNEGARRQQQGDLRGAVEQYRQSLERYPDKRLEAYIRQLEGLLQPHR